MALAACARATIAEGAEAGQRRFTFKANDVIVLTGGANTVAAQENGYLEALLILASPESQLRSRDMAWEGDTVYEQRRDLNFGPWPQQFKRVGATVIFAQFGQMESLEGEASLLGFVAAYERLLGEFSKQTQRIVLVSPFPFQKGSPPLPDLSLRNGSLAQFVEAIGQIARRRGWYFVDLFHPFRGGRSAAGMTSNGVVLTAQGHWLIAREISRQLRLEARTKMVRFNAATGVLSPPPVEQLRQSILAKNRLWFDYWRPMNWAFLAGDRTEQPSSRDHRDPTIRWFPSELEKFVPLIEEKERTIAELANRIRKER